MTKYKTDPRDGKALVPPGVALAKYLTECAEEILASAEEGTDRETVDAFIDECVADLVAEEKLPPFPDSDNENDRRYLKFYEAAQEMDLKQYLLDAIPDSDDD